MTKENAPRDAALKALACVGQGFDSPLRLPLTRDYADSSYSVLGTKGGGRGVIPKSLLTGRQSLMENPVKSNRWVVPLVSTVSTP